MISVNGYKAFHGKMLIQMAPLASYVAPYVVGPCDWIYIPELKKWISENHSYSDSICTPMDADSE